MKYLQSIQETSYLTATNAVQYRRIMRVFFQQYEKMHFQLYKEDVFDLLKEYPEFEEYSMERLKTDLNALVEWKNLTPIQDPKRVYTIADYKNKQFRYSMSEYAVEIERLTVKLENLFMESGSLSTNLFVRINEALEDTKFIQGKPLKDINEWWRNLQEDFKRLNQNYQDYLREFYSGRADKVLKSVDFVMHKDLFISYLKDFIQELQLNSFKIEATLKQISDSMKSNILELVIKSELAIPHPTSEHKDALEINIRENVQGKWKALESWFVSNESRMSESNQVLEITNEVIRKIIQNAALIAQLQNWGISRKDDYKKFLSMFMDCEDINESHKLSAHVFGIQNVQHFKINETRSTDSISSSTYDEDAMIFSLKPHNRIYKSRIDKSGFENKAMEKLAQRNLYLEQAEADRKMVIKYIKDNKLDISEIRDCISENTRMTLLRWISAANTTNTKKGRTEFGQEYKLRKKDRICTLKCEDGELVMPAYVFEFMEREK
jgi:uncharacterized protein (TIGR02677 family)